MVPTISVLVAGLDPQVEPDETAMGLLILGNEPSQPASLIRMPIGRQPPANHFRLVIPRVLKSDGSPARAPSSAAVLALRMPPARPLTDAELLIPVAAPALPIEPSTEGVTWLIEPDRWSGQTLAQGLQSLGAQSAAGPFSLAFIGSAQPEVQALADQLFEGRIQISTTAQEAVEGVQTGFIGYLGGAVILHDPRSIALLKSMLSEPQTATASAMLVSVEKRGKGWIVSPADAGQIGKREDRRGPVDSQAAIALWRSSWPVILPPRDFWVARTETVRAWGLRSESNGRHICTALLTASYCAPRARGKPPISPPPASIDCVLTGELVVG
jgi:hypothetical protein